MIQPKNVILYLLYAIKLTRVEEATHDIIHFQKRMHLCNFLRRNKPLRCFVPPLALHLIFSFIHTVRCRTQPQTPWLVETNFLRKHRLVLYLFTIFSKVSRNLKSKVSQQNGQQERKRMHSLQCCCLKRVHVELIMMASGQNLDCLEMAGKRTFQTSFSCTPNKDLDYKVCVHLNSSDIDELGNWCLKGLRGAD